MVKNRLTKDTEAYKLMEWKIVNQEVDFNLPPKDIYATEPIFQNYTPDQFRTCWNRLKAEHGINVRAASKTGKPNVAGAGSIAEARTMMENVSVANMQALKQPAEQQGAKATSHSATSSVPPAKTGTNPLPATTLPVHSGVPGFPGGLRGGLQSLKPVQAPAAAPPLAFAQPLVNTDNHFAMEKVVESTMLEITTPHMVVKVADARARRDQLIAIVQCLSGCEESDDYYAEVRVDEAGENKVLAVKVKHHPVLEKAEMLLAGLTGLMGRAQLVLASRQIDALVGEMKGGDNTKRIHWTMKMELPVAVSTTFVHQGIYTCCGMAFLMVVMEAQEANKLQQKSNFEKVSIDSMDVVNFDD
jgi:hypothetical protein